MATSRRPAPPRLLAGSLFLLEVEVHRQGPGLTRTSLEARNAVGVAHWESGRLEDAMLVLKAVVEDCVELLGRLDSDTLVATGNLAMTYIYLEWWEEGIELLRTNTADREQAFGQEHPLTLSARHAQAIAYHRCSRLPEALTAYASVAAQRARVLGPAHPDTVASRVGLALARADSGDITGAVPGLAAALQDIEQSSGSRTGTAMAVRGHLADCHAGLGQWELAVQEFTEAAADGVDVLGADHPLTLSLRQDATEAAATLQAHATFSQYTNRSRPNPAFAPDAEGVHLP